MWWMVEARIQPVGTRDKAVGGAWKVSSGWGGGAGRRVGVYVEREEGNRGLGSRTL